MCLKDPTRKILHYDTSDAVEGGGTLSCWMRVRREKGGTVCIPTWYILLDEPAAAAAGGGDGGTLS